MADQWTDRLSEYLDDELAPDERRSLEAHLLECRDCADTLAGAPGRDRARGVTSRGRPATDLWPGIDARMRAAPPDAGRSDPRAGTSRLVHAAAAGGRWPGA